MKKLINGDYKDMTLEEVAEMERQEAEAPAQEPTLEEQLADLTELVGVLAEVIANE